MAVAKNVVVRRRGDLEAPHRPAGATRECVNHPRAMTADCQKRERRRRERNGPPNGKTRGPTFRPGGGALALADPHAAGAKRVPLPAFVGILR